MCTSPVAWPVKQLGRRAVHCMHHRLTSAALLLLSFLPTLYYRLATSQSICFCSNSAAFLLRSEALSKGPVAGQSYAATVLRRPIMMM